MSYLSLGKLKFHCLVFNLKIAWRLWEGTNMSKQTAIMLFAKPVGWPASSVTVMLIFFMPNTRTHSWSIQVTLKGLIAGTGYLNQNCPGKSGTQSYIFSTVVCVAQNYISTVVHTLCCFSFSLSRLKATWSYMVLCLIVVTEPINNINICRWEYGMSHA